jgi:very-short-patch-repair endonuclease
MSTQRATAADLAIARVAAKQHGVIALEQLRSIGVDSNATAYRLRIGRLHRVHRGVYAVGHSKLSDQGRWMAAVLACGPRAVLSHRSAAALWRMLAPRAGPVDITVPSASGRAKRTGIRLRRTASLTQQETTRRTNIPVTSPARTLADLRSASVDDLNRARRQAKVHGYPIHAIASTPIDLTRSELERRFLRLCTRRRLPSPEVNVRVGDYVVDFLWRRSRLIVETDGYRYHSGRAAFDQDHRRQAHLIAAGYEVLRFTWSQVVDDPSEVATAVRARLTPTLTQPEPATR